MIVVTYLLRQSITLYKNLGGGASAKSGGGGLEPLSPIASAATAGSLGVIFGKLQEYFAPTTSVNSIYITYTKYSFYRATPVRLSVTRRYCV